MIESVRVTVRLFAGLRERAGTAHARARRCRAGRRRLGEARARRRARRAALCGQPRVREPGDALHDGDEVALIPPVSGGAFRISAAPLDLGAAVAEAASDEAGAVATFVGTVRRSSRGRDVLYLEYEAYEEMAEPMLAARRRADGEARALRGRDPPPDRPRRDR